MKVSEALEGSPFDFYYRRKFERIIEKAEVGELDLATDWPEIRRRLQTKMSFNIWGLLFGGLWGVYRSVPYAVLAVLFVAATIAAPFFINVNEGLFRTIPYSLGVVFGFYGNGWLLTSYLGLMRDYGDKALVERETRPSLLQAILAIAVLGITGIVVETPPDELRLLAQAVVPIQRQAQSTSTVQNDPESSAGSPQFPPGYDTETFGGKTYGFKLIDGGSCGNPFLKCGRFELISPEDCSQLTATYKIFDTQKRQVDTDSHTIRDVSAMAPVLMKFYMLEPSASSYEVTNIDCS